MQALLLVIGAIVAIPTILAAASIWNGYVLSVVWGWFLVPYFNAPPLTIPVAIGVSLVVSMLTHQDMSDVAQKNDDKSAAETLIGGLVFAALHPAVVLFVAWIVRSYL